MLRIVIKSIQGQDLSRSGQREERRSFQVFYFLNIDAFIYFAIWSPLGASLEITPFFTPEDIALGKRRKNKEAEILEKNTDFLFKDDKEATEKVNKAASVESRLKRFKVSLLF